MKFTLVYWVLLALFTRKSPAQQIKICYLNKQPVSCNDPNYLSVSGDQSGNSGGGGGFIGGGSKGNIGGRGGGVNCKLNGVSVPCDDSYLQVPGQQQLGGTIGISTKQNCVLNGRPISCTDPAYLQVVGGNANGVNQCFFNNNPVSCTDPRYLNALNGGKQTVGISSGNQRCFLNQQEVSCQDPLYLQATQPQQPNVNQQCTWNGRPVSCTDQRYLASIKNTKNPSTVNQVPAGAQCYLEDQLVPCNDPRYQNAIKGSGTGGTQSVNFGNTEQPAETDCTFNPSAPGCNIYAINTPPPTRKPPTNTIPPNTRRTPAKSSASKRPRPTSTTTTEDPYMYESDVQDVTTAKASRAKTCGKQTPVNNAITPLIHNGEKVALGEFPWVTAIYDKTNDNYLICGGSILTPFTVISAAHCFFDEILNTKREAENYVIAVGKVARDYNTKDSTVTKFYDVERIIMEGFFGIQVRYLHDIAILQMKTKIEFNYRVSPVCIRFTDDPPPSGVQLHVAGWGTEANGTPSSTLMTAKFLYLSSSDCIYSIEEGARDFINGDKFCVYHANATALDRGDSGSGLTYKDDADSLHYFVGLVSSKASSDNSKVSIITDVNKYNSFIKRTVKEIHKSKNFDTNYL